LSLLGSAWQAHRTKLFAAGTRESQSGDVVRGLAIPTAAFLISIPIAFISTSVAEWSWLVTSVLMLQLVRILRRRSRRHTAQRTGAYAEPQPPVPSDQEP
jgi:hypothetical protein